MSVSISLSLFLRIYIYPPVRNSKLHLLSLHSAMARELDRMVGMTLRLGELNTFELYEITGGERILAHSFTHICKELLRESMILNVLISGTMVQVICLTSSR